MDRALSQALSFYTSLNGKIRSFRYLRVKESLESSAIEKLWTRSGNLSFIFTHFLMERTKKVSLENRIN